LERHGHVDTLLNNTGGRYFAAAAVITPKGFAAAQRLNIDGTLQMTRPASSAHCARAAEG